MQPTDPSHSVLPPPHNVMPPPPPPIPPRPSKLTQIWNRITTAFECFFCSSCCTDLNLNFNRRDVLLLRDDRLHKPITKASSEKKLTPLQDKTVTLLQGDKGNPSKTIRYSVFDEALESLREFFRDFASLAVDAVHDKHLKGNLEKLQKDAPSVSSSLKSLTKLLVEVGDRAAKPVFQKFAQQKAQVIDPTLQKIFKTLLKDDLTINKERLSLHLNNLLSLIKLPPGHLPSEYIQQITTFILSGGESNLQDPKLDGSILKSLLDQGQLFWTIQQKTDREALYLFLEEKILTEMKDAKLPARQNLTHHYTRPILDWLLRSDHSTPLTHLFKPLDIYREDLIDKVFEKAIALLVERKIDQYANVLEKTLQNRLEGIIHHTLNVNAGRFTDFLSERLAEIVTEMPFSQTFDAIIHDVVHLHIQGVLAAEQAVNTHRALLEKTKLAAKIIPKNAEQLETKTRAQNHLASIVQRGGEQAFFDHIFLEEFSVQRICNPSIQTLIKEQSNLQLQGKDPSVVKQTVQKAIFTGISESLLQLMLPARKKLSDTGEIIEKDPFSQLWERVYLPLEFKELTKHVEELVSEFITPETASLFAGIKQPAVDILKNMFKSAVQDILRKQLVKIVQQSFEKMTIPASFNEFTASVALPAMNEKMLKASLGQLTPAQFQMIAPLFAKLLHESRAQRPANITAIQQQLIHFGKEKFKHFSDKRFYAQEVYDAKTSKLTYQDLTPNDWMQFSMPAVLKMEKELLDAQQLKSQANAPAARLNADEISETLVANAQAAGKANDPIFGQIAMDLIFKVGGWPHEGLIGFFIRENLSTVITENMREMRASHHLLITSLAESLKNSMLNQAFINDLLGSQGPKSPQFTSQKLAHQLEITSRIAHDMLMYSANQKGAITKFAVKKFVTDSPDAVENLIKTIYQKVLGNQTLNENLILNVCEKIFASLGAGADTIRMNENLAVHQAAAKAKIDVRTDAKDDTKMDVKGNA